MQVCPAATLVVKVQAHLVTYWSGDGCQKQIYTVKGCQKVGNLLPSQRLLCIGLRPEQTWQTRQMPHLPAQTMSRLSQCSTARVLSLLVSLSLQTTQCILAQEKQGCVMAHIALECMLLGWTTEKRTGVKLGPTALQL